MMIEFLLIILVIILIINYFIQRNIFSPSLLLTAGYFLSTFVYYLNKSKWDSNLSFYTIGIIIISILVFTILELFVKTATKNERNISNLSQFKKIEVDKFIMMLVVIINVLTITLVYFNLITLTGIRGDLPLALSKYKEIFLSTGKDYSTITNFFIKISSSFSYIFIYIVLYNITLYNKKSNRKTYFIPILTGILLAIFRSNRLTYISYLVFSFFSLFIIKYKKNNGSFRIKLKNIFLIFSSIFIFLLIFYAMSEFIGRNASSGFFDYISIYIGSSIPNLNSYFNGGEVKNLYLFQEIFPGLINSLEKLSIFSESVSKPLEFRTIANGYMSNVYTGVRRMYNTGGVFSLIVIQSLFSLIINKLYYNLLYKRYSPYKFGLLLIIFSKLIYTVPLQSIEDQFFINVVSIGYVIDTIILVLCYYFVIKMSLRNKNK